MDNSLVIKIYGINYFKKLNKKIRCLGIDNKMSAGKFIEIRLFTSIFLSVLPVIIHFFNRNLCKLWYIEMFIVFFISYYLIKYILIDLKLKNRKRKLESEAYYFFEVLTLSLESGRNLEEAINITCMYIDNDLSKEFKQMLFHIKLGKSLKESLDDLRKRIPSKDINSIILNISEASSFGTNITKSMKNELDYLEKKQLLKIKEEINKIPNKVSIISVLFIVPLLFILILSPLIIKYFI